MSATDKQSLTVEACADGVSCEGCDLCRVQAGGAIEDGITNDVGWWCAKCVTDGSVYTSAELDWYMFAMDYPEFAHELAALRKLAKESNQ